VHAYAHVLADEALAAARAADAEMAAGGRRSPLHGLPIGVKDNIYTQGSPSECGSRVMAGFVPDFDASCVARLRAGGAIIIGKTHCHEFAYGVNSPPSRSPWALDRYAGGSSIGSGVAVTSRSSFGALGSDTGGSIRVPASINNLVGMKATYGRVSIHGVVPVAWALDHVGPMTRTVRDNALLLAGMAGHETRDPTSARQPVPDFCAGLEAGVKGLRIGIERNYFFYAGLDAEIRAGVEAVIAHYQKAGAQFIEISLPELDMTQDALFTIVLCEGSSWHRKLIRQHADKYDPATRAMIQLGELLPATQYIAAQQARRVYREALLRAFADAKLDAMLNPTMPVTTVPQDQLNAPRADGFADTTVGSMCHHTFNANLAGLPAMSVPCGITAAGLPYGFQLTGRAFDEATLYRIARAYERDHDWHTRRAEALAGGF